MNSSILSRDGAQNSLLVASFGAIPETSGVWEPGFGFLLKVDNDEAILIKVLPANASGNDLTNDYVDTIMSVGWNPEIIKGIYNADGYDFLKWGY